MVRVVNSLQAPEDRYASPRSSRQLREISGMLLPLGGRDWVRVNGSITLHFSPRWSENRSIQVEGLRPWCLLPPIVRPNCHEAPGYNITRHLSLPHESSKAVKRWGWGVYSRFPAPEAMQVNATRKSGLRAGCFVLQLTPVVLRAISGTCS